MGWIYLPKLPFSPETEADSSPPSTLLGPPPSVTLNTGSSSKRLSYKELKTGYFLQHRSGTISEHSEPNRIAASWISSARAFRASLTHLRVNDLALKIPGTYGRTLFASLENRKRRGWYWRMSQLSFSLITTDKFSGTWPKQGMMLDGVVYLLMMSEPRILATDGGLLPTPLVGDANLRRVSKNFKKHNSVGTLTDFLGGKPNPRWVEYLMGWPEGWADNLNPLGKGWFHSAWLKPSLEWYQKRKEYHEKAT